jgi:uncharacterized protein
MEPLATQAFTLPHPAGTGRDDEVVSGDIRYIDDGKKRPLAVISHGYKTSKDWGMFPHAGEYFAGEGYVTIVPNFARNGVRPGEREIRDWQAFARLTPSSALDDLHLLLDAVREGALEYYGIDIDGAPIALIGHSTGAGISILAASERNDIDAVCAWSPLATFNRYPPEIRERWRENGWLQLPDDPELGPIRLGPEPLEDIEKNAERLDILQAASRMKSRLAVFHGTDDATIPVAEGESVYAAARDGQIVKIDGADHLYGASVGYEPGSSPQVLRLFQETKEWLHAVLQKK